MPDAVTLGPLFVPMPRLMFVLAMVVTLLVSFLLERRYKVVGAAGLWLVLLAGFAVGRLFHVLENASVYASSPIDILYVWQGGFNWIAGVLVGLGVGVLWSRYRRQPYALYTGPVIAGALVWVIGSSLAGTSQVPDRPLPELRVLNLEDEAYNLADLAGEPTVINLWASWCPPCRREMPVFERAQDAWPDIHFVYANQGENVATALAYLHEHDRNLQTVLVDSPSLLSQYYQARGLPTTLFYDAAGQLQAIHPGEISAVQLANYLRDIQ